jgi:hypothetical protein
MKKNVLALGIAAAIAGFAGSAFAVTDYVAPAARAAGVVTGSPAVVAAAALQLSTTGTGHMLVVPYFSAQNGNKTLLSLTNTDSYFGKAVKVRFRGAANSDDLYDFQVFLSPGDVWTAEIRQGDDGFAQLVTGDNSCTKPASVNQSFKATRLKASWSDEVKQSNTREGYIEIFNMADVAPIVGKNGVYESTKHSAAGTPLCTNVPADAGAGILAGTAWTDIDKAGNATADLNTAGLIQPTTGLMANWTIINVPNATAWSGAATAVEAVDAIGGVPGTGAVVYFPQVNAAVGGVLTGAEAVKWTADRLLQTDRVSGQAQFDLPDMSTTYVGAAGGAAGNPETQAIALTAALATTSISNEFWTLEGINGATDWVFSMPTRRYSMAVDYQNDVAPVPPATVAPSLLVFNPANVGYFTAGNVALDTTSDIACVQGITNSFWNREEGQNVVAAGDTSSSPGDAAPTPAAMCGETSILSINDVDAGTAPTKVLGGQVTVRNYNLAIGGTKVQEGWMRLATPGAVAANGLPIIGSAFMSAFNSNARPGVLGNYNMTFPHRTTRP